MSSIAGLYTRLIDSFGVAGLAIPATYIKIYPKGEPVPSQVSDYLVMEKETVMCCQASRHASLGSAVYLTLENIGCVAAAISLGLVDQNQAAPLPGNRVYTCIMHEQVDMAPDWQPPSPAQFTSGEVYACKDSGLRDFCLFGPEDAGRFADVATAAKAVEGMMAIQPPTTDGVFFFSNDYDDLDLTPDLVVLSVRPVELTRLIQGYSYLTGKRIIGDMGALRSVNSDLIARPYLTGEINVSPYCLGSRLVTKYEGDRLGISMPYDKFLLVLKGMEDSRTGYPFAKYPGAAPPVQ